MATAIVLLLGSLAPLPAAAADPELIRASEMTNHLKPGTRVHLEGVVLFQSRPNRIYCQDSSGPIRAILRNESLHPPGELVRLEGQALLSEGRVFLVQSTATKIGEAPLPAPIDATLDQAFEQRLDAVRIRIHGRVLGHQIAPDVGLGRETILVEDVDGGSRGLFRVRLPRNTRVRDLFPVGTVLRAIGQSILEVGTPDSRIISVYPNGLEEIDVLSRPWLDRGTLAVLGAAAVLVGLFSVVWMAAKRRQFRLIRQSEERLRALSEHSFDATCVLDPDGEVRFMTLAARRFLGSVKPDEMPTRDCFFSTVHPDDQPRLRTAVSEVLARKGSSRRVAGYRIRTPDGSDRWAESIITNGLDVPGVEGIVVNLHDITEQAEAFQALARAADLQRHLAEFATSLSPLDEEKDVLREVIRKCISHLGFQDCVIYLHDEARGILVQSAALGPKDLDGQEIRDPLEIRIGQGIVGAAAAERRTVRVGNTRLDPRYIVDDAVRLSELAVPILAEGKVLGVIDSEHPRAHFFTEDHQSVLESIAFLCANKIVRARTDRRLQELNRDLERRIAERTAELQGSNGRLKNEIAERTRAEAVQRALFGISEAVHSAEDLPHLYERIHAIIGSLMPARNFYLALLEPETGRIHFPYHRDEQDPPPPPRCGRKGMTEYVLRTGRAMLADLEEIRKLREAGEYEQTGHPAAIWLGVPLQDQGRTFGVMAVQDHRNPRAFGEEDKRLLNFVAGQTALAIERKRSEAELRQRTLRLHESEERFRRTFAALPSNVSLVRLSDHRFVEVNEAVLQSTGFTREELIGKTTQELGIWDRDDERAEFFRRFEAEGRVRAMEVGMRRKSGYVDIVMISAERIEMDGVPHILALSINISERKKAEEELLRALARERELSRLKSEFVSLVSHEFRTPIGIIHSSAEILERYLDRLPPAERLDHLKAIQNHSWRMASLMEAVLVFGRAEAGKLDFQAMEFDPETSVRLWIDEFQKASSGKHPVRLAAGPLPPKAYGDPDLFRHILTNLVSNAAKFSPEGSEVTVSLRRVGDDAVLVVADRGAGIPEADRGLLFTAFHRGSNVRHVPGTGLGLAIIRRCVDLHGGSVRIDSTEGAGTQVTVELPLFRQESQP